MEKLKYKSLMIGDYISVKPSGMPINVAAVHHKKVAYHAVINKLVWVRKSLLEPIPITAEILEKNGFEKIEAKYYRYFLEEKDYYESVSVYFDEEPNVQVRVLDGSEFRGRIKYVHQLQQASRLCNIRKEIEL